MEGMDPNLHFIVFCWIQKPQECLIQIYSCSFWIADCHPKWHKRQVSSNQDKNKGEFSKRQQDYFWHDWRNLNLNFETTKQPNMIL